MPCVGIIANPASGRDIRRLVAHGLVINNNDKVNIVRRVLLGLDAMGVDTVVTMPDSFDICRKARENLTLRATVRELDMPIFSTQDDTTRAAAQMREMAVDCLVSLGGDGTNRALAKTCGSIPLLPLSTGTNNVFPSMFEGTLAGIAAGLVACGTVATPESITQRPCLEILRHDDVVDLALIDAVVCTDQHSAARAIWDMQKVRFVVVAQRLPAHIGFMALAGNLPPLPDEPPGCGLVIETDPEAPTVLAPIAPGLIMPVGVKCYTPLTAGQDVALPEGSYMLALDGEREVRVRHGESVQIRLSPDGPRVINPHHVLAHAAQQGVFVTNGRA